MKSRRRLDLNCILFLEKVMGTAYEPILQLPQIISLKIKQIIDLFLYIISSSTGSPSYSYRCSFKVSHHDMFVTFNIKSSSYKTWRYIYDLSSYHTSHTLNLVVHQLVLLSGQLHMESTWPPYCSFTMYKKVTITIFIHSLKAYNCKKIQDITFKQC
jgi:hypothetical protein